MATKAARVWAVAHTSTVGLGVAVAVAVAVGAAVAVARLVAAAVVGVWVAEALGVAAAMVGIGVETLIDTGALRNEDNACTSIPPTIINTLTLNPKTVRFLNRFGPGDAETGGVAMGDAAGVS